MLKNIVLALSIVFLTACGGGGSSSDTSDRDARRCVSFANGQVINSCDFAVVARTFAGSQTPVTVPANGSVSDPDANFGGFFGACRTPFTPVSINSSEFRCE